ncbi:hypothetical protein diail_3543 [Diaporthe ilicicola]|nr:hypothetical protein diail_3543 [Diaporthe ilicicola]
MAYNPYGGNPYGPPPSFNGFPGVGGAPGMAPPPGLGPPPGMSSAPGMAPPPGVQQANSPAQANRPSGLPASFQPPPNLPNINFNAPVIRLGSSSLPPKPAPSAGPDRRESNAPPSAGASRPGLGADRNLEQSRAAVRESMQALQAPTQEERLRTIFLHKIPETLGGDEGVEKFLSLVGRLRRWDSSKSNLSDHKGELFGFAQFDDPDSLATAVELLKGIELPVKKQEPTDGPAKDETGDAGDDEPFKGIEKVKLQVTVDESTLKFLETCEENRADDSGKETRLEASRAALKQAVHDLFYPPLRKTHDGEGDVSMGDANGSGENVEVINIPIAQEDELADIPAEMREVVAQEIAAFRDRSIRRDLERLRREEEMEEMERLRNGAARTSRDSPPPGANSIPLGPRGVPNAPSGPRGAGRGVAFINGTNGDGSLHRDDDDTDASDEELHQRELSKHKAEDDKQYLEAERKWVNRERQRAAALERETDREKAEADSINHRIEEQLQREKNWDDEKEVTRKTHPYYRDHAAWARKRAQDRAEEESRDETDRRAEQAERRREAAEVEQAKDMADSFLNQQAQEIEQRQQEAAAAAAPTRFTMSLGAAAQKAQQRAGPQRRTMAEVEGLLDDEENEQTTKRQLVPIKFEPLGPGDAKAMSEEEIQQAVKSLAQEIPTAKEGLWAWDVKWDYLDDSAVSDKLRPFIEKKVVEYLGVQEQLLVDVVEEHLRRRSRPAELVEELEGPLEDDAEDLVKKLWRMVIFFTESEKRGLPA